MVLQIPKSAHPGAEGLGPGRAYVGKNEQGLRRNAQSKSRLRAAQLLAHLAMEPPNAVAVRRNSSRGRRTHEACARVVVSCGSVGAAQVLAAVAWAEVAKLAAEADLQTGLWQPSPPHAPMPVAALPRSKDLFDAAANPVDRLIPGFKARQCFGFIAAPHAG
jgi:hypothetical protein